MCCLNTSLDGGILLWTPAGEALQSTSSRHVSAGSDKASATWENPGESPRPLPDLTARWIAQILWSFLLGTLAA